MQITKVNIKELTDSRSWKRGVNYHQQGNVISLLEDKDNIIGKVSGTRNYKVELWVEDDQLNGTCSCPMGEAGVFCKHCVAVGLTYLEGGVDSVGAGASGRKADKSKPTYQIK